MWIYCDDCCNVNSVGQSAYWLPFMRLGLVFCFGLMVCYALFGYYC